MAYVNETYTAPTYTKAAAGYGILCNNETILCDSERYDCVGAIVMTDTDPVISTVSTSVHTAGPLDNYGFLRYGKESYS
jgi:hypothetical protein